MQLNSIVNACNHLYKLISSQVPREEKGKPAPLPLTNYMENNLSPPSPHPPSLSDGFKD